MLWKKLWRTMLEYRAQFLSMVIMIALGIGMFVGFNMEWASIEYNTSAFFEQTGFADYRVVAGSERGFSAEDAEKIRAIPGVERAARYLSVNVDVRERTGGTVALSVTEDAAVSGFVLMEGAAYDAQSENGIWLSDRYAEENDIHLGDTLTLVWRGVPVEGKVVGLIKAGEHMICVRDESQLMPDYRLHGYAYISPAMYRRALGQEVYPQIYACSSMEKEAFCDAVDRALGETAMILDRTQVISWSGADGEVEEGKMMGSVLPVLFLLIATLTMVTTMHRLAAKEKTQIGILKALGFRDRRILRHYTGYSVIIGVIGSALGVGLGYLVAWLIMNPDGMMGTYMDLPRWHLYFPPFCFAVLAAVLILLALIGYLSVRRILHGTAAEALRPYTPKKMKPLAVERTAFFHRLSFGTRWNLRDIMRHKSTALMSIIGVVGSMVLMLGSLGMGDTMDAFLDLYYDGATNYRTRIYLSEDATPEEREAVIDAYGGDTSASVAVQLGDKTVSLDIYHITHDKVRFPDEDNRYVTLPEDGAYVCVRIAEEFGVRAGDTLTLSPYGSSRSYTIRVAGIVRSVSESIVMSDRYAATLEIPYTVDSVYTDTEKAAVRAQSAIKATQDKQSIMDSFDSFLEMMNMMILLLIVGAFILGIVVLYNLGVMSYTERYREMATLKVLGFRDRKIGRLLIGENLWLSVIGMLLGIPAGIGTLDYLLRTLASEYEMKMAISARTILVSILLTVGMSLLVGVMVARKNKKINMVEALKCAE